MKQIKSLTLLNLANTVKQQQKGIILLSKNDTKKRSHYNGKRINAKAYPVQKE